MKARILILLGCLLLGNTIEAHPIHMSVVNIDINLDSSRIDYSVQLFYEDFQTFINYRYNTMIDFSRQTRMTSKEQHSIIEYITSRFHLTDSNERILNSEFQSWKIEDKSIWLFFCTKLDDNINVLQVKNELLIDLFDDQINYVIYRNALEEVGIEFNKRKTTQSIKL